MYAGPTTRNMLPRVLAGLVATSGLLLAQQAQFAELRRWRWRSPDVVCGAADAAGTIAALGQRDASGSGWEVLLWDPKARRPLRTVPVNRRPIAARFPDGAHVEVRLADTDAFFSLSHWHRFRIADGAAVGEPKMSRVEDDDPLARKRMRGPSSLGDEVNVGPEPCVLRERRAVSWWKDGVSVPIADFAVRAVELTPDGRFAVVWLPSRLVAIPVAGGDARFLPVASETIRAIDAGANGDELVVVTVDAVRLFRVAAAREVRSVPFAAERAFDAALAPGGGLLGLAFGGSEKVVLLDLDSGRVKRTDVDASAIAWTADGRRLACASSLVTSVDRDGKVLGESRIGERPGEAENYLWLSTGRDTRPHVAALDGDTDAWSSYDRTVRVTVGKEIDTSTAVWFVVHAQLSPTELIATNGMRLLACDAASWETTGEIDLRVDVGQVAVAPVARRVAVVAGPEIVVLDARPVGK